MVLSGSDVSMFPMHIFTWRRIQHVFRKDLTMFQNPASAFYIWQRFATFCNASQFLSTFCNIPLHFATLRSFLSTFSQHFAGCRDVFQHLATLRSNPATFRNILQHFTTFHTILQRSWRGLHTHFHLQADPARSP